MPSTTMRSTDIEAQEAQQLRAAVGRLARHLRVTAGGGLTASQLSALSSVVRHGPLRVGDLVEREGVNPTTLSRIVGRLEELGLVERTPVPADRRSAELAATEAGRSVLRALDLERSSLLHDSLRTLEVDQQRAIRAALPALDALVVALRGHSDATQ